MIRKLLREPLLHFFVLGAGIFLLYGIVRGPSQGGQDFIVVTSGKIEQLVEGFTQTWQRPPTQPELMGLIDDYIKEEVFDREALAMGLDKDDVIIRRRLRLKMEFLSEDNAPVSETSDPELQAFLNDHPQTFLVGPKVSFDQIYFNPERRGEKAKSDAEQLLAKLSKATLKMEDTAFGDSLPLEKGDGLMSEEEIAKLYGADFASKLLKLSLHQWQGPVQSGYGIHLVRINEREEGRLPKLSEIREAVLREWSYARERQASDGFYQRLRGRYTVKVEWPEWSRDVAQKRKENP